MTPAEGQIDWARAVHRVPAEDWLAEFDLDALGVLDEVVSAFVFHIEGRQFLAWEAAIREEQDLPLSLAHEEVLDELVGFADDDEGDERILYINEQPRPTEPWYATLRRIAPLLLVEPFDTTRGYHEALMEGWPSIASALDEHGAGLSLPEDAGSPEEVVPAELRHRLWAQFCFEALSGVGQEGQTLADTEGRERIEDLVDRLREHRDSVRYLDLSIDGILDRLRLPAGEARRLLDGLRDRLALPSSAAPIADHL